MTVSPAARRDLRHLGLADDDRHRHSADDADHEAGHPQPVSRTLVAALSPPFIALSLVFPALTVIIFRCLCLHSHWCSTA